MGQLPLPDRRDAGGRFQRDPAEQVERAGAVAIEPDDWQARKRRLGSACAVRGNRPGRGFLFSFLGSRIWNGDAHAGGLDL